MNPLCSVPLVVLVVQQAAAPGPGHVEVGAAELPLTLVLLDIPGNSGAAWLDYDSDGWVDVYNHFSGWLIRNQGGTSLQFAADLDVFLPPPPPPPPPMARRYGASCADYDADGFPDIACEPRLDCFYVLHNLGGTGTFVEVATDPEIVIDPPSCEMMAETFCWADVDDDGDLDLWAPAYADPPYPGSSGNVFFENLGPTGPGGAHRLSHREDEAGLVNPSHFPPPEGAQFVDVDRDGDVDGYANSIYYENVSRTGAPKFHGLDSTTLGVRPLTPRKDEGIAFLDHDLDGDQDLLAVFTGMQVRIFDNEGDGTFVWASTVVDHPAIGSFTGCSAEDWDLDGDVDVSATDTFRRNMLVETGIPFLRIVPDPFVNSLSPAWADWDRDGDPDAIMSGWAGGGGFGRNDTYEAETPLAARRTVRIRPVGDSPVVARGLENQFGATAELRVRGDASGFVRRRFVASSHGYLQQSEYALTMALPPGPDPEAPALGVVFDLLVDFPGLLDNGLVRIDRTVNPALGDLELAALVDREITVFRSGKVRVDGIDHPPLARFDTRLRSTGPLVTPGRTGLASEPAAAPAPSWCVGLELDTHAAAGAVRVEELVLDGQLAPSAQRGESNVQLWDVTRPAHPLLVRGEQLATSPRNDRSFRALAWTLRPERLYRVLCRVTELRASPQSPWPPGSVRVHGGLSFANPDPGQPFDPLGSLADPQRAYLELRYRAPALDLAGGTRRPR